MEERRPCGSLTLSPPLPFCTTSANRLSITSPRLLNLQFSQVSAERKKRAAILESEGSRESAINEAEGRKRAVILASEARRLEQANNALGEAEAIRARAEATAHAINLTAKAIGQAVSGRGAGHDSTAFGPKVTVLSQRKATTCKHQPSANTNHYPPHAAHEPCSILSL